MDEFINFMQQVEFWHWWVAGMVIIIAEITLFGAFFLMWVGVAAFVVGLAMLAVPGMEWQSQLLIWAVLSIGSVVGWHFYRLARPPTSDEPLLNQRGAQYVGRVFTLEEPVVNGQGKIKVDDSMWKIEAAEDFEVGTKVRAVSIDGTVLNVERA